MNEMNEDELKLSDLLEYYCEIEGIRIVRVLNLDIFFGVLHGMTDDKENALIRFLDKPLIEKLKNNQLTERELLGKVVNWHKLVRFEEKFSHSGIKRMIMEAESKGYVMDPNKPKGYFMPRDEPSEDEESKAEDIQKKNWLKKLFGKSKL